jgi:hypothetical protein
VYSAADDSELLKLEKNIFEQHDAARAYDDEATRLGEIWQAELSRLDDEVYAGRSTLTTMERWALVTAMPEAEEHERVVKLQQPFCDRQDAMIERMFSAGRRGAAPRWPCFSAVSGARTGLASTTTLTIPLGLPGSF